MISQNGVMIGAVTLGYFLFIVQKGELGSYLALLKGNSNAATSNQITQGVAGSVAGSILNAAVTGQITNNPLPVGTILPATTTPATGNANQDVLDLFGSDEPTQYQIDAYVDGQ
jgi:hypothetical protein